MFTGIVTDVGRIARMDGQGGDRLLWVETAYDTAGIDIGASIAHDGVCLTVTEKKPGSYAVQAAAETMAVTTLGDWQEGRRINLERAARLGDELGGHIVSGHVDGVGTVRAIAPDGWGQRFTIEVPADLAPLIAPKGSVTVNGVSLTVNEVAGNTFGVCVIPHTQEVTTFGDLAEGDRVNIEIDMLARYVARLLDARNG